MKQVAHTAALAVQPSPMTFANAFACALAFAITCAFASSAAVAQECPPTETKVQPAKDYEVSSVSSFVVLHKRTQLEWQRCSLGQLWNGYGCFNEPRRLAWDAASAAANADASFGGRWRLPSGPELLGIIESGCINPAVNTSIFPGTFATQYWSANSVTGSSSNAWAVNFNDGSVLPSAKSGALPVRLVRSR